MVRAWDVLGHVTEGRRWLECSSCYSRESCSTGLARWPLNNLRAGSRTLDTGLHSGYTWWWRHHTRIPCHTHHPRPRPACRSDHCRHTLCWSFCSRLIHLGGHHLWTFPPGSETRTRVSGSTHLGDGLWKHNQKERNGSEKRTVLFRKEDIRKFINNLVHVLKCFKSTLLYSNTKSKKAFTVCLTILTRIDVKQSISNLCSLSYKSRKWIKDQTIYIDGLVNR